MVRFPQIHTTQQIDDILSKARDNNSLVAHTLVKKEMRQYVIDQCQESGLIDLDLMGPALTSMEGFMQQNAIEQPGLYREKHSVDLDQVYAIDFALAQDDGVNPANLADAEIILVGLSRAGKTPLSMYLAVLGWKTANVPLVIGAPMPETLKQIDRRRIIALNINAEQLISHRKLRRDSLGTSDIHDYSGKREVEREIQEARQHYLKNGYTMIDVSNKPIETSAEEIIEIITRRFKSKAHKR